MSLWDLDYGALGAAAGRVSGAFTRVVDVTDAGTTEAAMAAEDPDIVVHAAGILGPVAPLWEHDPAAFRRVIEVNLTGSFLVARATVRAMRGRPIATRDGRLVLISSIQGKEGMARGGAYAASKAGVDALVKAMGKEHARDGIRVNAVAPAAAETAMARELAPERRAEILARIPMGRFVEVDEVAAAVAWLCSPDCGFTTGWTLDLSGGRATY